MPPKQRTNGKLHAERGGYLSLRALEGLKSYAYKPSGYTVLDDLHQPVWNCECASPSELPPAFRRLPPPACLHPRERAFVCLPRTASKCPCSNLHGILPLWFAANTLPSSLCLTLHSPPLSPADITNNWLPLWLAPNLITLMGLWALLAAYALGVKYLPEFAGPAPTWLPAVKCAAGARVSVAGCRLWGCAAAVKRTCPPCRTASHRTMCTHSTGSQLLFIFSYPCSAAAVFFYLHMDCLDGKQARRTKNSSPLGQLFDHGALQPRRAWSFLHGSLLRNRRGSRLAAYAGAAVLRAATAGVALWCSQGCPRGCSVHLIFTQRAPVLPVYCRLRRAGGAPGADGCGVHAADPPGHIPHRLVLLCVWTLAAGALGGVPHGCAAGRNRAQQGRAVAAGPCRGSRAQQHAAGQGPDGVSHRLCRATQRACTPDTHVLPMRCPLAWLAAWSGDEWPAARLIAFLSPAIPLNLQASWCMATATLV